MTMIFRIQNIVGALMLVQTLALQGAVEDEIPERELAPFHYGYGDGYGFTTPNNRLTRPRVRGDEQGSLFMRPYSIGNFEAYNPDHDHDSHSTKSTKGASRGDTRPTKAAKATKGGKGVGPANGPGHFTKGGKAERGHVAEHNPMVRPARGRSYLNAMHWERIPGQPIFVSNTDVPIIVLDEQPTVVVDGAGNTILTDSEGNEIIVSVDETGTPTVTVDTLFVDETAEETEDGGR